MDDLEKVVEGCAKQFLKSGADRDILVYGLSLEERNEFCVALGRFVPVHVFAMDGSPGFVLGTYSIDLDCYRDGVFNLQASS